MPVKEASDFSAWLTPAFSFFGALSAVLEDFALHCTDASHDKGKREPDPATLMLKLVPAMPEPVLDFSVIQGEWKVLPATLMYHLRELPVSVRQTARTLEHFFALNEPYHIRYFNYRRWHYARAGLRALWLSARLRRLSGLPASKLIAAADSPYHDMRRVRKSERSYNRDH